jgi:tRNA(Ile)-lysidine synthase
VTLPTDSATDRLILQAVRAALAACGADADASRIAIGFSGGVDSTVLLDAAVRVLDASRVLALHVHHGLSPNAQAWQAHCAAIARGLGVGFATHSVQLDSVAQRGVEACARDARYAALEAMCDAQGVTQLWVAHHADDQAETVLLQLLRGAGLRGLAAMPVERPAAGSQWPGGAASSDSAAPRQATRWSHQCALTSAHDARAVAPRRIVRPFLAVLRSTIEAYAVARGLQWIDDESNSDTRYARNALRHDVLPRLGVAFPGYRDALARSARHAHAAQLLLDDLAALDLDATVHRPGAVALSEGDSESDVELGAGATLAGAAPATLSRRALLALTDRRIANVLRYWMRGLGLPAAPAARLDDMVRQLRHAGGTASPGIEHAGRTLRCYRDAIFWDDEAPRDTARLPREPCVLRWQGESVWRLPPWQGSIVFAPTAWPEESQWGAGGHVDRVPETLLRSATLSVRERAGGERIVVAVGGARRTLKNLFQEYGVPAWRRDVPLLYLGERLLWVPGIGCDRELLSDALAAGRRVAASGNQGGRYAQDSGAQSQGAADSPDSVRNTGAAPANSPQHAIALSWRPDLLIA